jgi:hypothetical protein
MGKTVAILVAVAAAPSREMRPRSTMFALTVGVHYRPAAGSREAYFLWCVVHTSS